MGDFGFGFLKPPGEVVMLSLGAGAELEALEAAGFLVSVVGAFALGTALAVDPAVVADGFREVRLALGATGDVFEASFGAVVLPGAFAGAGDFAVDVGFGAVVGVLGWLGAADGLGRGLFAALALLAEALAVDMVAGLLPVAAWPVVALEPLAFALVAATFGVPEEALVG